MRPNQWIKNIFVFTGFFFTHSWTNGSLFIMTCFTALSFCLISSAVYILNDLFDIEKDRNHERKKNRPLAAGTVSITAACVLSCTLAIVGGIIGIYISWKLFAILCFYILLNVAYTLRLKKVVIMDVFCISLGFMLRILAGTIGLSISPSKWLLLCSLMLTLYLGFTKRRSELIALADNTDNHREVLKKYGKVLLDEMIVICATGVILTYSLYTMSEETIKYHHTDALIYTVPFVIYGIFRYMYLLHNWNIGGEPSRELLNDNHVLGAVIGWSVVTIYLMTGL